MFYRLDDNIEHYNGHLFLEGYNKSLPKSLKSCHTLQLKNYNFALHDGFEYVNGTLDVNMYSFMLPKTLKGCSGNLHLGNYDLPIHHNFICEGTIYINNYHVPIFFNKMGIFSRTNPIDL